MLTVNFDGNLADSQEMSEKNQDSLVRMEELVTNYVRLQLFRRAPFIRAFSFSSSCPLLHLRQNWRGSSMFSRG